MSLIAHLLIGDTDKIIDDLNNAGESVYAEKKPDYVTYRLDISSGDVSREVGILLEALQMPDSRSFESFLGEKDHSTDKDREIRLVSDELTEFLSNLTTQQCDAAAKKWQKNWQVQRTKPRKNSLRIKLYKSLILTLAAPFFAAFWVFFKLKNLRHPILKRTPEEIAEFKRRIETDDLTVRQQILQEMVVMAKQSRKNNAPLLFYFSL